MLLRTDLLGQTLHLFLLQHLIKIIRQTYLPSGTKYIKIENSGSAQARIKTITLNFVASANDPTDEETIFVQTEDVVISGSADALPTTATITVTQITSGSAFDTATSALENVASKFKAYDVVASSQPTTALTLTLAIPSDYDADRVSIAYISDNGEVEMLDSSIDKANNTVSAIVEHFSTYAVVEKALPTTDDGGSDGEELVETIATIDFSTTAQRTSYSTTQQVWSNDGLTLVNDKSSSGTDVGNFSNPARFYKGSNVTIEYTGITKIYIESVSSYSQGWVDSIDTTIATATKDGNNITITLKNPADTFTITGLTAQSRAKTITVYGTTISSGDSGDDSEEEEKFEINASSNDTDMGTVSVVDNVIKATPKNGYTVAGYDITNGDAEVIFNEETNEFTVTATSDVTIVINFELVVEETTGGYYVKVEAPLDDWSGDYLLVYEDGNVAFDGSLTTIDANLNNIPVVIENKTIQATATRDAAKFTVAKQADGTYTVKSASGYYIGHSSTSAGLLNNKTTTYANTITFENGVAKICGTSGFALQFNASSGTERFRYYNGTQKNIALYKYVESLETGASITATVNDETMGSITVTGNVIFANAATGYEVVGYTIVSGNATVTQQGSMFTVDAESDVTIRINFATRSNKVTFIERTLKSTITATTNSEITLPKSVGSIGSSEVFDGWLLEGTDQKYAAGATYKVENDVTFVAQFKEVESEDGEGGEAIDTDLTLTFDASKANRTEYSTAKQVWSQNGVTLTNNKSSSTNNVADYGGPARFYASSEIIISCENMVKIVFNANTTGYATALKNSIGANATVSGKVVTVVFDNLCNEINIAKLTAQVRLDSMVVTTRQIAATATPVGAVTGAQVNVGADLSFNFYSSMKNIDADAQVELRVTMYGETNAIARKPENVVGGEFVFTVTGIAPQCMTDLVSAQLVLIDDGNEIILDTVNDYSIQKNISNLLKAYAQDQELVRFLSDMLHYGAAAQQYTNYKADTLVTAGVEGLVAPSDVEWNESDKTVLTSTEAATADGPLFRAASVWFDTQNGIIVKLKNTTAKTTLKVNGVEVELDGLEYKVEGIKATDYDKVYTFELYEDGVLVQTLKYSINSYAYSQKDSSKPAMKALATALYRLGKIAEKLEERGIL